LKQKIIIIEAGILHVYIRKILIFNIQKMSQEADEGRIELIVGPMFSGKSTRLIGVIRKFTYKAKKTIMVKYFADKRFTEKSEVVTHDLLKYDSIECKNLREHFDKLKNYDIIGIDEGQFFPDLVEVCEELALMKKTVIIAALNGDFRMEPFPVIAKIIPKADKIKLLKAYCFNCHKDARFTLRIVQSNETVLIGAGEAYKPACRECHIHFSKEREKGNLNIDEILKDRKEKEVHSDDNITPVKEKDKDRDEKDSKDLSSSSAETSPLPAKREEQVF
jgi:thymidine kinase